jgi:hypothetical protein
VKLETLIAFLIHLENSAIQIKTSEIDISYIYIMDMNNKHGNRCGYKLSNNTAFSMTPGWKQYLDSFLDDPQKNYPVFCGKFPRLVPKKVRLLPPVTNVVEEATQAEMENRWG